MHSWPVQSELNGSPACAETSLLHARRPSLWYATWELSRWRLATVPPSRDRSGRGPGHRPLLLTGSSLHGGPQCDENSQPRTYRNLCCSWVRRYVPAWHFTDGDVALLTEQARGGARQV